MPAIGHQNCPDNKFKPRSEPPPPRIVNNRKGFRHFAFTLAETLITLTIIGIVAAMTIPTLIGKYQKHTYVVGLKKAYSQLYNAVKMIPLSAGCSAGDYDCAEFNGMITEASGGAVYDGIDFTPEGGYWWGRGKSLYILSKQFKIQKFAFNSNEVNEFYNVTPKGDKDDNFDFKMSKDAAFLTDDGMVYTTINSTGGVAVDINGAKGPNTYGRDIFFFALKTYDINSDWIDYSELNKIPVGTVVPVGSKYYEKISKADPLVPNVGYWKKENLCTREKPNSLACAGRVLEEDAMNY